MNVLVIGANGITGQLVVQKLAERGYQVCGMIHKAGQVEAMRMLGELTDIKFKRTQEVESFALFVFFVSSGQRC